MLKRFVLAVLTFCLVFVGLGFQLAGATGGSVVISKIQTGSSQAKYEIIEIHNNTIEDVDVTDWCIRYSSASDISLSNLYCIQPITLGAHVFLPSYKNSSIISNELSNSMSPSISADGLFTAGLSSTAGHIRLIDNSLNEVDKVGWGLTAVNAEGNTGGNLSPNAQAFAPSAIQYLKRKSISQFELQDTNINSQDVELATQPFIFEYGSIYEIDDACSNLPGFQLEAPEEYGVEGTICEPPIVDICTNIDGIQVDLPYNYEKDENDNCVQDLCLNIVGLQDNVPKNYYQDGNECLPIRSTLIINELFPNPDGDDGGNEYIEIFNPNNYTVDLDDYFLTVGIDNVKTYNFPYGLKIEPEGYIVLSNTNIKYTLTNTGSKVSLFSLDGQLISSSDIYSDAKDDMSWSLIGGSWQYTNQPTPGSQNHLSLEGSTLSSTSTTLKPCAPNQYRNPETNRCRLISSAATLTPCKVGQYRSEETNRCRNISEDAGLVPCEEGQERNPETNRCRNVLGIMATTPFAITPVNVKQVTRVDLWVLGGVILLALIYALWEWRLEFAGIIRKLRRQLTKTKPH